MPEEKPAVEEKPPVVCPFCSGAMAEAVPPVVLELGTIVKLECKKCGFQATFRKPPKA